MGASSAPTFATPGGGGDALTTNPLSQFAATTSAQLYGVLSDETGSATGTPLAVFNQAPQIDNIELGAASDTTLARSAAGRITVETKRLSYLGTTTTESATSHTLAAGDDVLFLSWTNTDAKTYTIATGTAAANDEWTGMQQWRNGRPHRRSRQRHDIDWEPYLPSRRMLHDQVHFHHDRQRDRRGIFMITRRKLLTGAGISLLAAPTLWLPRKSRAGGILPGVLQQQANNNATTGYAPRYVQSHSRQELPQCCDWALDQSPANTLDDGWICNSCQSEMG